MNCDHYVQAEKNTPIYNKHNKALFGKQMAQLHIKVLNLALQNNGYLKQPYSLVREHLNVYLQGCNTPLQML